MAQCKGLVRGADLRAIAALKSMGGATLQMDATVLLGDIVCIRA